MWQVLRFSLLSSICIYIYIARSLLSPPAPRVTIHSRSSYFCAYVLRRDTFFPDPDRIEYSIDYITTHGSRRARSIILIRVTTSRRNDDTNVDRNPPLAIFGQIYYRYLWWFVRLDRVLVLFNPRRVDRREREGGRRVISDPLDDTSLTLKFVKIRFDSVSSIASTIKRTIKQSFSPFIFPLDFCSLLIRFIPKHNVIVHSIRLAKSDSRFVRDFFPSPNFK